MKRARPETEQLTVCRNDTARELRSQSGSGGTPGTKPDRGFFAPPKKTKKHIKTKKHMALSAIEVGTTDMLHQKGCFFSFLPYFFVFCSKIFFFFGADPGSPSERPVQKIAGGATVSSLDIQVWTYNVQRHLARQNSIEIGRFDGRERATLTF